MASTIRMYNNNYLRFGLSSIRKISPCCGFSLESGAKLIAIAQLTISLGYILLLLIGLVALITMHEAGPPNADETKIEYWKYKLGLKLTISILLLFVVLLALSAYLHRYLYKGIQEKSLKKINLWWNLMLTITLVLFIQNIALAIKIHGEKTFGFLEIVNLLFDIYSLWVIYEYKTELNQPSDPTVEFERVL